MTAATAIRAVERSRRSLFLIFEHSLGWAPAIDKIMSECRCKEFLAVPKTWAEVEARFAVAEQIRPTLKPLGSSGRTWMSSYRCDVCRRVWAGERPLSALHGGGPELLYSINVPDPATWTEHATPIADALRCADEDQRFFQSLGPEVGPDLCREPGCTHKRSIPGQFCRCHHFEMVFHRPCPFWQREVAR